MSTGPRFRPTLVVAGFIALTLASPSLAENVKVVSVDCAKGESLNAALRGAADPLVVEFSGTCEQDVAIARSNVTLRGTGNAPSITGAFAVPGGPPRATIVMRGVHNVLLSGFSVTDADGSGIEAHSTSALTLEDVTAMHSARHGLEINSQTSALLINGTFDENGSDGIGVWDNSSLELHGRISASRNGRAGVIASANSSITNGIHDVDIRVSDNRDGFWVQLGARAFLTTTASSPMTVTGNSGAGVMVTSGSGWSSGDALLSTGNRFGLYASEGIANIGGATLQGSSAEDLHLEFGSHLTARAGTTAAVVSCDATVLSRGAIVCPPQVPSAMTYGSSASGAPVRPRIPAPLTR